jgi:hypothetical protein
MLTLSPSQALTGPTCCGSSVRDWRVNLAKVGWADLRLSTDQGAKKIPRKSINSILLGVSWSLCKSLNNPKICSCDMAHMALYPKGMPGITCGPPTLKPGPEGFRSQMTMLSSCKANKKNAWVKSCDDSTEVRIHGQYKIIAGWWFFAYPSEKSEDSSVGMSHACSKPPTR